MNAVVAERGQVTIPKPLRQRMGITPKTVLDFHEENGRLIVVKASGHDPVSRVKGCLKLNKTTNALMETLRGKP
jgi:AbrB family looped-hinge helix DNA binding protein